MRHRVLSVAGIFIAIVAVAAVALAIALWTVDVNRFVPLVAERVKAATGRDLRVEGGATLHRSRNPRLELRDVTLSNPAWASTPALVRAKRIDVQVAFWPLLHRRLEIQEIGLVEPVIALETDPAGRGNWELATTGASGGGVGETSAAAAIALDEVRVDSGIVTYRGSAGAAPLEVRLDRLRVHGADRNAPFAADIVGSVAGIDVAGTLHTGPLASLGTPDTPFTVVFDGEIAGKKSKVDTRLVREPNTTRLEPLAVAFGDSSLSGSLAIEGQGDARKLLLKVGAPRLILADLSILSSRDARPASAAPAGAPPSRYLVPDTPLPVGLLRELRADGELAVEDLAFAQDRHLKAVRIAFASDRSRLDVRRVEAGLWGGHVEGRALLDASGPTPQLEVHLSGRDIDLGTLLAVLGAPREVRGGKTALRLNVIGRGPTLHALASTATGDVELVVGTATLVNTKAEAASMLAQLNSAVNPLHASERATELKCAVVRAPLENGVARFDRTVAIETQTLGVSGTGSVDLRDETLDVALHPSVREGIPIDIGQVADLVHVRGSWRTPRVSVDATRSVATVARLGAIVATGGLPALGGLFVLGAATQDGPCAVALGAASARKPSPRAAPESLAKPAEDLLKGLGKLFQR